MLRLSAVLIADCNEERRLLLVRDINCLMHCIDCLHAVGTYRGAIEAIEEIQQNYPPIFDLVVVSEEKMPEWPGKDAPLENYSLVIANKVKILPYGVKVIVIGEEPCDKMSFPQVDAWVAPNHINAIQHVIVELFGEKAG